MSIYEQPMNVYWSGKKNSISNKYKMDYKKLVEGLEPLLNWQKTEIAPSVAFYPLSAAPINLVVNFTFTETSPAEGDKSVGNPSTLSGVSTVSICRIGASYISGTSFTSSTVLDDAYAEATSDGWIHMHLHKAGDLYWALWPDAVGILDAGESYSIVFQLHSISASAGTSYLEVGQRSSANARLQAETGVYLGKTAKPGMYVYPLEHSSIFANDTKKPISIRAFVKGNDTLDAVFRCFVVKRSEIQEDYLREINLGGIYYGGSVNLSTGTMTVTHIMVEPDSLSFDISAHPANTVNFQYADTFGRTVTTDGNTLTITGEAGGQIVYNLATPEIVSLSSLQIYSLSQPDLYTPCLNTVFSDQQSVQVGYPKSPLAASTELTNAIVSLGGNI